MPQIPAPQNRLRLDILASPAQKTRMQFLRTVGVALLLLSAAPLPAQQPAPTPPAAQPSGDGDWLYRGSDIPELNGWVRIPDPYGKSEPVYVIPAIQPDLAVIHASEVDAQGNVFCTGPGGVWVCRANGELLGRIILPELPANLAWGEDGSVLFFTARTSVYRLQTKTHGTILA